MDPRQAEAFFDEHEDTIRGPVVFMGSPQEDADRGAGQDEILYEGVQGLRNV